MSENYIFSGQKSCAFRAKTKSSHHCKECSKKQFCNIKVLETSVSDSDPYHWAGSGSTSENVDLGCKKIVINSNTN